MDLYDRQTQLMRAKAVLLQDQARLMTLQAEARDDLKEQAERMGEVPTVALSPN